MSQQTNSLGSSPLSAVQVDEGGNPLFVATPRRAMGSALVSAVLDKLAAATGRRFELTATIDELFEAARAVEVDLVGLIESAEHQLAAEVAQLCPCGHQYHAFDVCGSCSCVDGPGAVAR